MNNLTPTIFAHMLAVYDELEARAELDTTDTLRKGGQLRFEGSKVEAFRAVGISQGYYTQIFDSLAEMGCIEQVRRGSGHQGTIILLHHRPEHAAFAEIYQRSLTRPTSLDIIRQQISNVERRIPDIDLKGFVMSLDQRLAAIEARLDKIEHSKLIGR